jgi:hypothetical protein
MDFYKEPLAPGIIVYHNVLENPKGFINDIEGLVEINNLEWVSGSSSDANLATGESSVTQKIRDVHAISIPSYSRYPHLREPQGSPTLFVHDFLMEHVYPIASDYATDHGILSYASGENWQLLKYGKGQHFVNHVDDSKAYPRTFSMSFYLNDEYEGGEIEFPRFDLKIKPGENMAIMFPANYVYNHIVHPVLEGTRYTVVNWFE